MPNNKTSIDLLQLIEEKNRYYRLINHKEADVCFCNIETRKNLINQIEELFGVNNNYLYSTHNTPTSLFINGNVLLIFISNDIEDNNFILANYK